MPDSSEEAAPTRNAAVDDPAPGLRYCGTLIEDMTRSQMIRCIKLSHKRIEYLDTRVHELALNQFR
jgi:hypothetical protein